MPYAHIYELPGGIRHNLPLRAQEIYRKAFNSAYHVYHGIRERMGGGALEETAHRVAWSAVKKKYQKDDTGTWVKK